MIPLGLSAADQQALIAALSDSHNIRIDVSVLTLDEEELSRISPVVLDGQVDVDADGDITTRTLSITLLDPTHSLQIDSDSPDDGALYADRLLQVIYSVNVPSLSERVDVPVFTGPVSSFERTGDQVAVEAQGKEALASGWIWRPLTIKHGARKVDAIRSIMADRAGERNFDLPDLPTRIPKTISLGRAAAAFPRARAIGQSMNRQLYYDGAGTCRLRHRPRRPVFTFRADQDRGSNITGPVTVSHDFSEVFNAVWVKGGRPKGQKKIVEAFAVAPKGHPLSPIRLGRTNSDGELSPRYLVHEVTNDHIRSHTEAANRAQALLDDVLLEELQVGFTAMPNPLLDPLDVVRVQTGDFVANVRVRQFSLPLAAGGDMTIGYLARVSRPARRRIRPHRVRRAS